MKNKYLFATFGFVCSLSLTACTLNFSVDGNAPKNPIDVEQVNEISERIDETDFTNDTEVRDLVYDINDWSKGLDNEYLKDFQSATLVRVVDGDTIIVDINGEEFSVRLIGVNTPESVAPQEYLDKTGKENTLEGKEASLYTKDILKDVKTVYLQKDISDTDKYGRLLRYVWIEVPAEFNEAEIESKMLNGILLSEHIAEVTIYHPDYKYEKEFHSIYAKHSVDRE